MTKSESYTINEVIPEISQPQKRIRCSVNPVTPGLFLGQEFNPRHVYNRTALS